MILCKSIEKVGLRTYQSFEIGSCSSARAESGVSLLRQAEVDDGFLSSR